MCLVAGLLPFGGFPQVSADDVGANKVVKAAGLNLACNTILKAQKAVVVQQASIAASALPLRACIFSRRRRVRGVLRSRRERGAGGGAIVGAGRQASTERAAEAGRWCG